MLPDVRHPLRLSAWLAPNCAGGKAKAALSDSFVIPEDLQAFQGYLTLIPCVMQELSENMGLIKLNQRLQDPQLPPEWFANIFPRDNPKNMRFSINFFTSIGLGGLTDALREHLAALPRILAEQRAAEAAAPARYAGPHPFPFWGLPKSCVMCELARVSCIHGQLKVLV